MGKSRNQTITANTAWVELCTAGNFTDKFSGTLMFDQTGTGTYTLKLSQDGGTTLQDVLDENGDVYTRTGSSNKNFNFGKGDSTKTLSLGLVVTNASGLSLKASVFGD